MLIFFPHSDFVFWHLPQLQYKNPSVQMLTFKDTTPSPFFRFYLGISSYKDLLFRPLGVLLDWWLNCNQSVNNLTHAYIH